MGGNKLLFAKEIEEECSQFSLIEMISYANNKKLNLGCASAESRGNDPSFRWKAMIRFIV